MKTYQERQLALAEELARAEWRRVMANEKFDWDRKYLTDSDKKQRIDNMLPLAAIAIKHMAEEFRRGYDYKYEGSDYEDLEERLITNGLKEPQTT